MAKKRSRKGLIIGLVVLAVLIAGTIVVLVRSGNEGPILVSVEPAATRTITQTVSAIGAATRTHGEDLVRGKRRNHLPWRQGWRHGEGRTAARPYPTRYS